MNPSYDNGFGSFGSGGTTPGGGVVPDGGAVSGGPVNPGGGVMSGNVMLGGNPMTYTGTPVGSGGMPMNPMTPMTPMSSGAGDVIIGDAQGKKSKKWVVVVLLVLVVLAIGAGVAWVVMNRGNTGSNVSKVSLDEGWDKYYDLLVYGVKKEEDGNGDQGVAVGVTNWYLPKTDTMLDVSSDYFGYYKGAKEAYDAIRDNFSRSSNNEYKNYGEIADAFWAVSPLIGLSDRLLDEYLNGGADNAQKYIENLVENNSRSEALKLYVDSYLDAELKAIELYNEYGCYNSEDREVCIGEIDNSRKDEYVSVSNNRYRRLENYYNVVFMKDFLNETAHMNVLIGDSK